MIKEETFNNLDNHNGWVNKRIFYFSLVLFAVVFMLCFSGCGDDPYSNIYGTGSLNTPTPSTSTENPNGDLLGDKPMTGTTPPLAENLATPTNGIMPNVEVQAQQIIERSRRYNTTTSFFHSLKHYWDGYEHYYFLSEDDPEMYSLILKEIDERGHSSHEKIRQLYDNIDEFFSTDNYVAADVCRFYRFITKDNYRAFWIDDDVPEYQDEFAVYANYRYSDGVCVSVSDAVLFAPYYLLQTIYDDQKPDAESMLSYLINQDRKSLFVTDKSYRYPSSCLYYIPGFEPLLYICTYYQEEVKNLKDHELVFSAPISTTGFSFDYFSGKVMEDYFIPFYDKTANRYGLASFDENGVLLSLAFRR